LSIGSAFNWRGAAFIAQQIARIFERRPTAYLFAGDITHGQPYLHRDDLVDAVVRAVDRRAELPDETVLLIGEEETPSYQEMQQRIGDLVHGPAHFWPSRAFGKPQTALRIQTALAGVTWHDCPPLVAGGSLKLSAIGA
jgi:nucleoside-diphosphate-sugar epimerase